MDCVTILAQAVETTGPEAAEGAVVPIDLFWRQITSLGVLEALTFISFGVVCLFYGWRVFKVLVVINFGLLGLVLGMGITQKIVGLNNQLAGGLIGMGVLAVLSVPLMRWAVCVLGAAAGGILTSGIWYACGLNEQYIWAGGLIGVVAGGMISFIVFKAAVILFASMWGSSLIVSGALALLYIYPKTTQQVESMVFTVRWFLPTVLMIPTMVGIIAQHKFVKGSKEWNL
ncbi:MAG: hypothetical protein JSW66_20445 [Phycisphaerales bacterium]|nr:MAG: hypothetical protein JSW66_20445 [Phycisphaerales bacterium]